MVSLLSALTKRPRARWRAPGPVQTVLSALTRGRRQRWRDHAARIRTTSDEGSPDRARALGDALEKAGDLLEAIAALTDANRRRPDAAIERHLVRLRRKAFPRLRQPAPPPWPPPVPDDPPGTKPGAREIRSDALTVDMLRNGILRHGHLLVRGLVAPSQVARLCEVIDRAFDAREAALAGRHTADLAPWWDPVERVPKDAWRHWTRLGQGLLTADSPRGFFEFMETVRTLRLDELIAGYLGERPAVSVEKCVLRRADASLRDPLWHQDGAFLQQGCRTVNAWFALSHCGVEAPGLDIVPGRLERILPTGTDGICFDWAVSDEMVQRELPGVSFWRPEFEPGDVLLFDHLLLHRTAVDRNMPGVRYAIESWFFASSVYPTTSTPLVI